MTRPPIPPPSPGGGDPAKSDDRQTAGMRTDLAGSAPEDSPVSPAPAGDAQTKGADLPRASETATAAPASEDPASTAHPLGGQLGPAAGGYGSGSAFASSGGGPDGEEVDRGAGPGPQTDWMRSAPGAGEAGEAGSEPDDVGRWSADSDTSEKDARDTQASR